MLRNRLAIGIVRLRRRWWDTEGVHEQVKVQMS